MENASLWTVMSSFFLEVLEQTAARTAGNQDGKDDIYWKNLTRTY